MPTHIGMNLPLDCDTEWTELGRELSVNSLEVKGTFSLKTPCLTMGVRWETGGGGTRQSFNLLSSFSLSCSVHEQSTETLLHSC